MVVTNNARLADLLRALRAHGWIRDMQAGARSPRAIRHRSALSFPDHRFNVRPTEINAAIGLEQLKKLPGFNASRRDIARRLDAGLAALDQAGDLTLIRHHPRVEPAPFGYTVLCRTRDARDGLRDHLEAAGIETGR